MSIEKKLLSDVKLLKTAKVKIKYFGTNSVAEVVEGQRKHNGE